MEPATNIEFLDSEDHVEESLRKRLEVLPPLRQQALMALSSGMSMTKAAQICDVNERTLRRWMEDPSFRRLTSEIALTARGDMVRIALAAMFEIIEHEAAQGKGTMVRYFLSRTIFADVERRIRGR